MISVKCRRLRSWNQTFVIVCLSLFALVSLEPFARTKEITDVLGRKFSIADRPRKVYSTSPPVTYMLYALDPDMIAGLNFPVKEWEKRYLRKSFQELPVLGGWFGQGSVPNVEMILKTNPEVIVSSTHSGAVNDKFERTMRAMPMPVINVKLDALIDYPEAFRYLGQMLGRRARGEQLAAYARQTLWDTAALADSVPVQRRVSVYYAEGVDGLSTECDSSPHAERFVADLSESVLKRWPRFALYGPGRSVREWRQWLASQPAFAGWRSRGLGSFGEVEVVVFEKPLGR